MKGKFEDYKICKNIWDEFCKQNNNQSRPMSLCHYTDTAVLDSILEHAVFWASNIRYMNDFGEYEWGAEIISKTERKVKYNGLKWFSKKLFSISFTEENDSLHQWLTYAKESGVCIELDSSLMFNQNAEKGIYYFGQESVNYAEKIVDQNIGKTPFRYEVSKILRLVNYKEPMYSVNEDHELFYSIVAAYAKNPAFEIEKESRAVFFAVQDNITMTRSAIKYHRKDNGILRPYIKVGIMKKNDKAKYEACIPIKSIIVGPSGIQQTIYDSVVHRCKYGIMTVHKYKGQDLCNRLNDIFTKAIEEWEYLHGRLSNGKKEIKKYLLKKWSDEHFDQEDEYDETERMYWDNNADLIYKNKKIVDELESVSSWLKQDENIVDDEIMRVIEEISSDNFVTAEGIWIKKSKIPYIYS